MPSAPEDNSNDSPGPIIDRDVEFAQVVLDGRKLLKNKKKNSRQTIGHGQQSWMMEVSLSSAIYCMTTSSRY